MKIERISIKNYRAIEEITIRLHKNLIPIVGVNEAGKSTILEAIVAFTPENDGYKNGDHLNPINIYTRQSDATIEAIIEIEDEKELASIRDLSPGDRILRERINKVVHGWRNNFKTVKLQRHLPNKDYSLFLQSSGERLETGEYSESLMIKGILDKLPKFNYFEDFIGDVENKIIFQHNHTTRKKPIFIDSKQDVWRAIVKEAFARSNIDFETYLTRVEMESDPDNEYLATHEEELETVNVTINKRLAEEWFLLTGVPLKKISHTVRFERTYRQIIENGEISHEHVFRLRLIDTLNEEQPSLFALNQRSKGYQWFCNFVLRLFYNGQYTNTRSQAIFLLDEPGSYLHPLAQDRLLDKLIEASKDNIIIYTTHLPQLVNPSKIRLHDSLIAHRQANQIVLKKYGDMGDTQSFGALTTLHNAMKINLPGLMFPGNDIPFALTEGITEFYVLQMIKNYTSIFSNITLSFIPGQGVDQLGTLISLAISWSNPYVVIFDKDEQAEKAIKIYSETFGDEQKRYWLQLENKASSKKVALEALFSNEDIEKLHNLTETTKTKRSYELLYFAEENEKYNFWDSITQETIDNFSLLAKKIENIIRREIVD